MKNLFLFLCIATISFVSCKSETNSSQSTEETATVEKNTNKGEPFPLTIGAFGATQSYPNAKMTSSDEFVNELIGSDINIILRSILA